MAPRAGRGGKVSGTPGTAYSNRTDLNESKPLPVTVAKGQGYGEAAAQQAAQQKIPLIGPNPSSSPVASSPAGAPTPTPVTAPTPEPQPLKTIHDPGDFEEANAHVATRNSPMAASNVVGGAASNDPNHLRLTNIVQNMADSPYSSTAMRELAEFMRSVIK